MYIFHNEINNIVNAILDLSKKKGATQAVLCETIGANRNKINDWKNGKSTPTYEEINKIAQYLEIETEDILKKSNDLSTDETEWLELYRKLSPEQRLEHRLELKGYIKAKEENK